MIFVFLLILLLLDGWNIKSESWGLRLGVVLLPFHMYSVWLDQPHSELTLDVNNGHETSHAATRPA